MVRERPKVPGDVPASASFDRLAFRKALKDRGVTVAVLDEAMRANGMRTEAYSHLNGTRQPSGAAAALYAALLGLDPGALYRVRLTATVEQAKRSLLRRRGRGRPKKEPPAAE